MRPTRKPSDRLFVVKARPARAPLDGLAERAPEIEGVEPLAGDEETCVVSFASGQVEPRTAWERVRALIGEDIPVNPVLVDDDGNLHYPTGTIQVRFAQAPSDEELERFARQHRLRLIARNRYQPAQSSFERVDAETSYLPDRVQEVKESAGVEAAWEEAQAHYRRY